MAARDMKYNPRQDKNQSMRLIIDCDPGNGVPGANIDDGLALALAIAAPQITLEMITIVAGNTPVATGYAVAKDFVQQSGIAVAVYRGAARALREDPQPWREKLDHGVDRFGLRQLWSDVPAPPACPEARPLAPEAIGEWICRHPGEITLVATGPLTNVAMALQLYPQMVQAVKNIVIMGGAFNVPGYIKDTNFGLDPEAAHAVLTCGAPIALVPMDVTTKTQMRHADLDRLAQRDNALSRYLAQTIRPWISYSMQTRNLPGCWIHDVLTIAWLLDPSLATTTEDYLDVSLEGLTRGMTCRYGREALRLDVGIPEPKGAMVKILQSIDNHQLLALIEHYIHHYRA
ncbi:inosine-uridine nucleoside N-ribohydrolase [Raoultella sp. BIGb0138]|nr:inosine-uridine nucleoside N-ribohydrolase [Raoultella sp. BIGb0138]